MEKTGSFTFVIYSHIPYVTSPDRFSDDINRLHEATAECYIPLLNALSRLVDEGISPKVVVGFSPLLTEMVTNDSFKDDFVAYLEERIGAAESDLVDFEKLGKKHLTMLARMWREFYSFILDDFTAKFKGDILKPFAELQEEGHIEIITSGATSGYLPLLSRDESIHAQISQAVASHKRHFGKEPRGLWLPEHGYRPSGLWQSPVESTDGGGNNSPYQRGGIEEFPGKCGIEYLITDTHLLNGDEPLGISLESPTSLKEPWELYGGNQTVSRDNPGRSPYSTYQLCGAESDATPLTLFVKDPLTGRAVAGLNGGYPSDGNYLDFSRRQLSSNLRYWRVTGGDGDLIDREEYHPDRAFSSIAANTEHFTQLVRETLREQKSHGKDGIVVSLFNATIFGQRWFEGHEWLYHAIASLAQDVEIERVTTGEYLEMGRPSERVTLSEGSWGGCGNHRLWLNDSNRWMWKRLYEAEQEMVGLVNEYGDIEDNSNLNRALQQAGRELLLLQSSDWPCLINTTSGRGFAEGRFIRHFEDFKRLAEIARHVGREGALRKNDWAFLQLCTERDDIFPDIEPLWFREIREKEKAF
ncbi:MAG: DUF1957 domain-containing protein [Deltaproteobacteria bacterium]|nr:DUF1957 domain-containing protein [Deltaproteobacteria bacterium]